MPAGTVALLGTEATDGLLEERLTCQPPAGANAPRLMARWAVTPPGTEAGATLNEVRAGWRLSDALVLAPKSVAVIDPVVTEATAEEPMVKVA